MEVGSEVGRKKLDCESNFQPPIPNFKNTEPPPARLAKSGPRRFRHLEAPRIFFHLEPVDDREPSSRLVKAHTLHDLDPPGQNSRALSIDDERASTAFVHKQGEV